MEQHPLKGAEFRLYATPECITPILTLPLTGDDGKATSTEFQITQEWYYLKESIAPPGYELSTTVIPGEAKEWCNADSRTDQKWSRRRHDRDSYHQER